jgi:site-specific DNA recombinase
LDVLRLAPAWNDQMRSPICKIRCAIYCRKSSEEGLNQQFNSLDAQYEACFSYIQSQRHEGWIAVDDRFDDGGFSGGTLDRPALQRLLRDIEAGKIDTVVCYKIDRLSRSLSDFVRMVDLFDQHQVSFISITQQFNTTTSMGRLTLNILLSFGQFERELASERIRDKFLASRKRGLWMGGHAALGYHARDRKLSSTIPKPRSSGISSSASCRSARPPCWSRS